MRRRRCAHRRSEVRAFSGGTIVLHVDEHVCRIGDRTIPLRAHLFKTLMLLTDNPGVIKTREQILDAVGADEDVFERSMDSIVKRLRRMLGASAIFTRYGLGYYVIP